MQPISLTIYGINSFKTEQKIDFSALPSGFFGIFGQTGSGKSTILDAITIALYGKTERAKRAIEFICASCDSASVKLVFNASKNGAVKTYMVERFFKKKKDDQTVDSSAVFYEKQGDRFAVTCEGVSAVDDAVKNKLGLSFSEFSKCIALPQGQFANFLNATSSERTNIVSNIFNLSKYGAPLQNSVSEKEQDLSVKLAEINGKLTQINDVSEENIKEIKSSLFAIKDEIELLEIDLKQKTEKLNKLKEIKFLLSQQEEAKKIEKLLLDKNNEMQELKEKLLKAKKVLPLFEKVKEAESLNAEILNLQNEFGNKKTELFSISKEYENIINESDIFNKNYSETYNVLLEKQNNLNGLTSKKLEIEKLNKKLEELNIEINNINNEIKNYQEELHNNSIIKDELQKKLDNINIKIKDKNVDTNIVLQIKKGAELKAQMEMLDKVMLLVDNERVVLVSRINELSETLKAYELKFKEQANNGDFNFEENENAKNEYEEIISKINSIKIENKENISTPNLLNELNEKCKNFFEMLKNEQKNSKNSEISAKIEKEQAKIESEINSYECAKKLAEKLLTLISEIKKERKTIVDSIEKNYGNQPIEKLNDIIDDNKKELSALETSQKEISTNLNAVLLQIKILENNINAKNERENNIKIQFNENLEIKEKLIKEYNSILPEGSLEGALYKIKNEINELDKKKTFYFSETSTLFQKRTTLEGEVKMISARLKEKIKVLDDIQTELNSNLKILNINNIQMLKEDIIGAEEINALEKTLDDFNARVSLNKKELESLNEKLNGVNLNYEELAILEKSSIAENSKLSSLKIEQGKKTGELERLESKIEEKLMLSDKKVAIETNLDYAKTLSKLLYGKALAQFICEEYLNNITIRANQILQNLEGGKFTIKFKDNNFLVEDNFNLGKERAASTLSGGETFLISLSLALAISETINIESGENQDFFFLDEGFGTLDSELLETVISALYKLEHQHTIIGVISHVEMLKERIKNKIIVSKTEDEGSKVKLLYTM